MSDTLLKAIFESPILGFAHHRIILDNSGKPIDYVFLEVNSIFEKLTGLKKENIINRTVKEMLPGIENDSYDWIGFYGDIALKGKRNDFEQYSEQLEKWFRVYAYSTEKMYFSTLFMDITEAKHKSKELESFFALNLDLLCITDVEGNFLKSNDAWKDNLGYSADELIDQNIINFIHPDDIQSTIDAIRTLKRGNIILDFVNRYRSKTGSYRWIEWRGQPEGSEIYIVARDITERKLAEETLRLSEKQSAFLAQTAFKLVELNSIQEIYKYTVQKLYELFEGNSIVALVEYNQSKNFWKIQQIEGLGEKATVLSRLLGFDINNLGGEISKKYYEQIISSRVKELEFDFPYLFNNKLSVAIGSTVKKMFSIEKMYSIAFQHGEQIIGNITFTTNKKSEPINTDLIEAFVHQISNFIKKQKAEEQLKESEEKFRSLTENTSDVIVIVDLQGKITYISRMIEDKTGYKKDEIEGVNIQTILTPASYKVAMDMLQKRLKGENVNAPFEVGIVNKTSEVIPFELNTSSITESGEIKGIQIVARDITERILVEKKLQEALALLTKSAKIAHLGYWELDLTNNRLIWSDETYRILGFQPQEFPATYEIFLSFVHSEDRVRVDEAFTSSVSKGSDSYQIEHRILRHGSGEIRYVLEKCEHIRDASGNIIRSVGMMQDITERKQAEEKIHQKDSEFRKLSANMPDLIFQFTRRTDGTYFVPIASEGIRNMFGCSPEDVLEDFTPISRVIFPEDAVRVISDIEYSAKHLTYFTCEFRVQIPGKEIQWIYSKLTPEKLPDGTITWYGFNTDITERILAVEKLRKLSQIVEQSPVSVVVSDLKGNIEYINPKFTELTGYSSEEVLGENPRILKSGEQSAEEYKVLWDTITSGKVWQGEFHNKKKDGTLFWETASISPILDEKGGMTHFLAIKEDVTQRKQAEDQLYKFLKVVDQSPNMIIITGLDAVIEYVNQSFCRISGYSSEDVIGKRYKLLKLAQADESEYEDLWNCLRSGVAWHGENIDKRKNGELYWQEVSINPILNEAGNTTNYVSILSDISDRRKMEDELQELNINLEQKVHARTSELSITNEFLMNEVIARKKNEAELKTARVEAEKANKAKSEFISRMSHELRTPMNSILGFAQLFAMGELTPGQRKGVDHMLNSGNYLLKLINEVLDISKIEAGKLSLSLEFIKVSEVINEAIDIIKPLAIKREIKIHYENNEHDQLSLKADKQRLIQVLVNLLNNAIKFNKQGGSITIKTSLMKQHNQEESKVQISITDTGVGISEKDFTKLFRPFERFGSTEQTTEGTGLGLSISKELMTLMGGTIGASSKLDKGSTFWVELPFAKNQTNSYSNLYTSQKNNAEQNKGKATILYIEDNDSNIELIEQVFNIHRPNSRLISHKYGNDTVQLAIENMPNIILLDLDLPDMHGSQVMELLKKNDKTKHIPVIIISADAMPDRIKKLMKAGVKNYLTKPFDVLELLTEIDKFKITYD